MHLTSWENASRFAATYCTSDFESIAEIGSQVVEGQASLRALFPSVTRYVGFDFVPGIGVDCVLDDPYVFSAEECSFDCVISSSCFEHAEFFWLSFLEMVRICRVGGLIYLQVPSNGKYHRYPVDCWRFYPDSGVALQNWARRNGYPMTLLESFVTYQKADCWNDFVAVFCKCEDLGLLPSSRIVDTFSECANATVYGCPDIIRPSELTEDMIRRFFASRVASGEHPLAG